MTEIDDIFLRYETHAKRYQNTTDKFGEFVSSLSFDGLPSLEQALSFIDHYSEVAEAQAVLINDYGEITLKMKHDMQLFLTALNIYSIVHGYTVSIPNELAPMGEPLNIKVDVLPNPETGNTEVTVREKDE